MLLFFLTLCLSVQSLLGGSAMAASDGLLRLYPEKSPELSGSLIPGGGENQSIPVTADGNISDWLSPKEEQEIAPPSQKSGQNDQYAVSGKVNVLIYHTHTNEAYRQTPEDSYEPSGTDRTKVTKRASCGWVKS